MRVWCLQCVLSLKIKIRKLSKHIILLLLSLLIFTMFIGCSSKENSKNVFDLEDVEKKILPTTRKIMIVDKEAINIFDLEQFVNQMKAKTYKFELEDVEKNFLPTTRKIMIVDKEAINIYLYNSNEEVEKDAKRIDDGGCSYSNGNGTSTKIIYARWASYPHFYKRGNIIVQYVGENEKIISDLKDILGEQFAGYSTKINGKNNKILNF